MASKRAPERDRPPDRRLGTSSVERAQWKPVAAAGKGSRKEIGPSRVHHLRLEQKSQAAESNADHSGQQSAKAGVPRERAAEEKGCPCKSFDPPVAGTPPKDKPLAVFLRALAGNWPVVRWW